MRSLGLLLTVCCVLLLAGEAPAAPQDIAVGETRAVQSKQGARLMAAPRPLGRLVANLSHGTRVKVATVRGAWIEVTAKNAQEQDVRGWLKATQTVQPYALTQGGQFGRRGSALARANARANAKKGFGRQDVAAAGRQLSASSEQRHRQASPEKLRQAYALLDGIETNKPTPDEVRSFVAEGRLGRPDQGRRASGQAARRSSPGQATNPSPAPSPAPRLSR